MKKEDKSSRILCLHGYRQCAKVFKEKLGAFRKLLKNEVEFYIIDAPHIVKNDEEDKFQQGNQNERSWWFSQENFTFTSSQTCESCIGFEESVETVLNIYRNEGPFDGLLGFSQGAAFAAILCSLTRNDNYFKFVILIAGFKSLAKSHATYYDHILQIPSLHVIGESDNVISKQKSEELMKCFDETSVAIVTHEGGHYVPAHKRFKQTYKAFITKYS